MCDNDKAQRQIEAYNQILQNLSLERGMTPESKLAKLMQRELGTSVTARELRLFIKAHWSKISALAHQIHDEE